MQSGITRIRFSLKGMLLVVVYFAIAAMALVHPSGFWSGLLWALLAVAVLTCVLFVAFWRDHRQKIAAGFALFAGFYSIAICMSPNASITPHLGPLMDLNIPVSSERSSTIDRRMEGILWELQTARNAANPDYRERMADQMLKAINSNRSYLIDRSREKTINALAVMVFGLLGAFIGGRVGAASEESISNTARGKSGSDG